MILDVYYKILRTQLGGAGLSYKTTNGTVYEMGRFDDNSRTISNTLSFGDIGTVIKSTSTAAGVRFGTGTTPPTKDDFNLSGDMITGFGYSYSINRRQGTNYAEVEAVYTITNTSDTEFTIYEVGYFDYAPRGATSKGMAMIEHTLLEQPITIEPGGVGQITYTIRMNYPTA